LEPGSSQRTEGEGSGGEEGAAEAEGRLEAPETENRMTSEG